MEQEKIGALLKTLRREKGLTQEEFGELFFVSNRTVSRWENGHNLPDIDVLVRLADYYEVDLRELLDGERRNTPMNQETEETVMKAVAYTNMETEKYANRIHGLLLAGAILWFFAQLISHTKLMENATLSAIASFSEGAAAGMVLCGLLVTSRFGQRLRAFKQRIFAKTAKN
ncbi:MAG: helix-turn-helix transcriptional regulator [Bacillota bacterium]|nr:helix-turn-helix transcriptional regulator [Bacillota bacterium]